MNNRPPEPIRAVSVVCRRADRFLLVLRGHAPAKGLLAFPGGRVEAGEADETAARRELLEETGLRAGPLRHLRTVFIAPEETGGSARSYWLAVFLAADIDGEPRAADDAAAIDWMTVDEMARAPVTGSTLDIARAVAEGRL